MIVTFYYPEEIERIEQWTRFLELWEAGAGTPGHPDVYRLGLMETSPI